MVSRLTAGASTCRCLCGLLLVLFLPTKGESRPFLYVTNSTSNTVSVVDAEVLTVIRDIPVGKEPFGLAFSPDGRRAFVANAQSREVSVIDTTRHRLIQNIAIPSELPVWVAAAPDGTYIYVTNERSHDVTVIASASNSVVGRIPVGKGPAGIAVSLDSRYAYVANEGSNDVSLVDLQRELVIETIRVGQVPQGIAMSPDGVWAYVANFGSNSVSVIASARNEVVAEIPVGEGPVGLAVSPDGRFVYSGNFKAGSLSIVDTSERREVEAVPTGAETFDVGVRPSGKEVYVASGKERQVVVVDTQLRVVRQKAMLGQGPFKLAVAPEAPSALRLRHLWMLLFVLFLAGLLLVCFQSRERSKIQFRCCLTAVFAFGLVLRVAGLDWGIPVYDAETVKGAPGLRVSFHPDEDNFLWNLVRVRPEKLDFAVDDFHWGTLQYHLITLALLLAQVLDVVSSPWRESFLGFHPVEYARIFVTGRSVSAILGSCSVFLAYGIGKRLYGSQAGLVSALVLALMPLHVVKSHDLTADIAMAFFVLLGFCRLLICFEHPSARNHLLAGLATGLAVAAKYSAIFLLPVVAISHFSRPIGGWVKKIWFYAGLLLGFLLGEPYVLVHGRQFWESVNPYLQFGGLPEGAVPGIVALLGLQLKNLAIFGLGLPLTLIVLTAAYRFVQRWKNLVSQQAPKLRRSELRQSERASHEGQASESPPSKKEDSGFSETARGLSDLRSTNLPGQPPRPAAFAPFAKGDFEFRSHQDVFMLTMISFVVSILALRQPMLRYTLPVAVLLVFPAANTLWEMSRKPVGRWLAVTAMFLTGVLAMLQVKILTQPHPVNQTFDWVERHLSRGASIQKGWPELPPLNPEKFQITNFFDQPRLADFREYFVDGAGKARFPDYVMLDNLPTLRIPRVFLDQLGQNYNLVAEFRQPPRLSTFELPEWDPPHDWKYSHPEIRIYRKKQ
ncbi:MAG TPA: glycosyltransferase family 39 protein [Terriglobia bacterium]|nr:glycosyltransferase family 39 protein [Terriglobia bacterium]